MTVKITGNHIMILAWMGSGGVGFSFCCRNMVTPISSGQTPIIKICGGVQAIRPNRLKTVVGSGELKSLIQPKKGA